MNYFCLDNSFVRISVFLESINASFNPKLSERVSIKDYAVKLALKANNIFICEEGMDIAHAAVYVNDFKNYDAYISSFSVFPGYRGKGYADRLLKYCKIIAKDNGMKFIRLEVSADNDRAIFFYKKHGFYVEEYEFRSLIMRMKLS